MISTKLHKNSPFEQVIPRNYPSVQRQIKISNQRFRPPRRNSVVAPLDKALTDVAGEYAGKNQARTHPPLVSVYACECGPRRRIQHLTPSVRTSHIARLTVHPWPSSPENTGLQGGSRVCQTSFRIFIVPSGNPCSLYMCIYIYIFLLPFPLRQESWFELSSSRITGWLF